MSREKSDSPGKFSPQNNSPRQKITTRKIVPGKFSPRKNTPLPQENYPPKKIGLLVFIAADTVLQL